MELTLSTIQIEDAQITDTSGTARLYYSDTFRSPDNGGGSSTIIPGGLVDSLDFFKEFTWTRAGTLITIPTSSIRTTSDSDVDGVTATLALYETNRRNYKLLVFEDWEIPVSLAPATTDLDLALANAAHVRQTSTDTYTRGQIDLKFANAIAGSGAPKASDAVYGTLTTSVPPALLSDPEAWGTNDTALGYNIRNYTTLANAVSLIGSTKATLTIASNITVSATLATPPTLSLKFINGAQITVASGQTLTINGQIDAGNFQIFAGSGSVVLSLNASPVSPAWFGAQHTLTNTVDSAPALQRCIDASPNGSLIVHPLGWTLSIRSSILMSSRLYIKYVGGLEATNSGYSGSPTFLAWNGVANGIMIKQINCNSCVFEGIGLDMVGSTPANTAAFGIYSTADYGIGLSGVNTTLGSPTVTFTGGSNFTTLIDSLPNGDAVHRGRQITIGANTYTILAITDGSAPGSLTLTTNALANVAGGTATIPTPYGSFSSSSNKFRNLYIGWGTATTTVAYRTGICVDLWSGQNSERYQIEDISIYGHGGALAVSSSSYGVGISFGGFYDSGSVNCVSPFAGYFGGSNILECHIEHIFVFGLSFGLHGGFGSEIDAVEGSYVNTGIFGSFYGTIRDMRFEACRQNFHGFGKILMLVPHIAGFTAGVPVIEIYGGSTSLEIHSPQFDAGTGSFGGTKLVQCTAPTNGGLIMFAGGSIDTTLSLLAGTDFTGFSQMHLWGNEGYVLSNTPVRMINSTSLPLDQDGSMRYCDTATPGTSPATSGSGTGAWCFRQGGVWSSVPSTYTGTGANVNATSPTLVTPNLGAATATSVTAGGVGLVEGMLAQGIVFDLNTNTKQAFFTVPAGKTAIVTRIVLRSPSASLAAISTTSISFGSDAGATNWGTLTNITTFNSTSRYAVLSQDNNGGAGAVVVSNVHTTGTVFGAICNIAAGSAKTIVCDVIGYYF